MILQAAMALFGEVGIDKMTIAAVAERAGVGKATIYRRWPTKAELVLAAVAFTDVHSVADTGSVRGDLLLYQREFASQMLGPGAGNFVAHMTSEAAVNADFRRVLSRFVANRRQLLHEVLERGVARGEIRADADLDLALELFSGPLVYRVTMAGLPIDADEPERLVDLVLEGLRTTR